MAGVETNDNRITDGLTDPNLSLLSDEELFEEIGSVVGMVDSVGLVNLLESLNQQNLVKPRVINSVRLSIKDRHKEEYEQEMDRERNFIPLDLDRASVLDFSHHGPTRKRIYSDIVLRRLVNPSYFKNGKPEHNIAYRSFIESTWGQIADATAEEARKLIEELNIGGHRPGAIELFTGLGSNLYSLNKKGKFNIFRTYEKNAEIFEWTREMWEDLELNGNIDWANADAREISDDIRNGNLCVSDCDNLVFIHADPPWGGLPNSGSYGLEVIQGRDWIPLMLKEAPVAGIKAPAGIENDEVLRFAAELDAFVRIVHFHMPLGNVRVLSEKYLLFARDDVKGNLISDVKHRRVDFD